MTASASASIPEHSSVSSRQWRRAWNPVEVVFRYVLASFFLTLVAIIPLGWAIGAYALAGFIAFPLLGILVGGALWQRSCTAVNKTYQEVLDKVITEHSISGDDTRVWVSPMEDSGEQYGLEAAPEYTFTRVEQTGRYTSIDEITVQLASLETSVQSERIPAEKISSRSFEDGTLTLRSTIGTWRLHDLEHRTG